MRNIGKRNFLILGTISSLSLLWIYSVNLNSVRVIQLKEHMDIDTHEVLNKSKDNLLHGNTFSDEISFIGNIPFYKNPFYVNLNNYKSDDFGWTRTLGVNKCGARPKLLDIEINNEHWQIMQMKDGPNSTLVYLYGAYLDTRLSAPYLRILVNSEVHWNVTDIPPQVPNFCQIWYPNITVPVIVKVTGILYAWHEKWGNSGKYHPYLITCNLPRKNKNPEETLLEDEIPESVSLVEQKCDKALNELHINYNMPKKRLDFGVCIKGLDMPTEDISIRMVHWIEMLRILGAKGFHFHKFAVHPNTDKVLKYYEKKNLVTVKPFSLPGFQPNLPVLRDEYLYVKTNLARKRRQEVIAYNDCFLSNMYKYDYIAVLDLDEIILPANHSNWEELVISLESNQTKPTSFCFQMILFVDQIIKGGDILATAPDIDQQVSTYPYMMNKLNYELKTICGKRGYKCLHNTEEVFLVHNHFPRVCLYKGYCNVRVNTTMGYVHHHKDYCSKDGRNETLLEYPFGYDPTIRRYNNQLMARSNKILREVGL